MTWIPALAIGGLGAFLFTKLSNRVPPITLPPNGRQLTKVEKFVLEPFIGKGFISRKGIDTAIIYFVEDIQLLPLNGMRIGKDLVVEAVTTEDGIYFPFKNHEFNTAREYALLAHELVHWSQYLKNGKMDGHCSKELPAYQLQIAVWQYLEND